MDISKRAAELREETVHLRRGFHMHPELGFQEERSAEKVEEYLRSFGLKPERIAGTGVIAVLEGGAHGASSRPDPDDSRPVLLLRADMDALPIEEENDLPYASRTKGVMHA